jgi:ABC-type uncharacterized transport system involved in gliding motility auxiliary subunit
MAGRNGNRDLDQKPSVWSSLSLDTLKGPALALGALLLLAALGSFMVNGFDTPTRILAAVGILLFGVFVAIDPEDVWRRVTTPGALYSGNALLIGAIVIGILGLVNVVANNRHQRWDWSANKQFSLSDQSLKVVADLPQPVHVTAFYEDDDSRRNDFQDLMREYQIRSGGKLTYELVDPIKQPSRAQLEQIKEPGTAVFQMGDRRQTTTGFREADITSTLLRLANPTQKKVYFTAGHNERRIDSFDPAQYGQLKSKLESDNYIVETLVLAGQKQVPDDASVVVIANPRNPFADDEKAAINAYLDRGGDLLILAEPTINANQPQVSLGDFVSRFGLELSTYPVAEGNPQLAVQNEPFAPAVVSYPFHRITEGLPLTFFPTATFMTQPKDSQPGVIFSPLLTTSDRSWAETNIRGGQLRFDDGVDPKGPLTLGMAIEAPAAQQSASGQQSSDQSADQSGDDQKKKLRVVVFGDADFASNGYSLMADGNRDLFLNSINWLAQEEQLISIRPKETDRRQLFLTAAQSNLVLASSALFLPLIILAAGAFVWWSRR